MKVSEVLGMHEAFRELGEKELPFTAALAVAENMEKLRTPAEVAIKKRNEITDKYLERDKNGEPVKVSKGMYRLKDGAAYAKEVEALENEEVEMEELKPIPGDKLSGISVEPKILVAIRPYIQ